MSYASGAADGLTARERMITIVLRFASAVAKMIPISFFEIV